MFDKSQNPALAASLEADVRTMCSAPRSAGSPQHEIVREMIKTRFAAAGFSVREDVGQYGPHRIINILAEPPKVDPNLPWVIVGAHYDSVPNSPGADDNASAVAALLALADRLGPIVGRAGKPRANVLLVAYDQEEAGVVGSAWHASRLREVNASVLGMIALEMLGYVDRRPGSQNLPPALRPFFPDVGDFIGIVGNDDSKELVKTCTESMKTVPSLPVQQLVVPFDGHSFPETRLSDHSPFWDESYPAVMITDTSFFRNPHYHQLTDTPDTLDYDFLAKVTRGVGNGVLKLAGLAEMG